MAAEYKRTCKKCGASWYVTKEQAKEKRPTKSQQSAATLLSIGTFGTSGGLNAANEVRTARVDALSTCPECRSTKFVQVKDGWLNKSVEKQAAVERATLDERVRVIEYYVAAGSPTFEHEPGPPPTTKQADVYHFAKAAQAAAKARGERLGFFAANNRALEALWYAHQNPPHEEPGAGELGSRIDAERRSCPFCAEPIRVEAIKCKHCGSAVEPLS